MKKLLAIVGTLLVSAFLLVGCSTAPADQPNTDGKIGEGMNVVEVDVNGTPVTCVVWDGFKAGGLSCDWESAK